MGQRSRTSNHERSTLAPPHRGQRSSTARARSRVARLPCPTRSSSVQDGLGRVRRVVVEAAAGLPPQIAPLHPLLELLGRPVILVLRQLIRLEARVVADVETGEVAQPERPQRVVEAELDGLVDIRDNARLETYELPKN